MCYSCSFVSYPDCWPRSHVYCLYDLLCSRKLLNDNSMLLLAFCLFFSYFVYVSISCAPAVWDAWTTRRPASTRFRTCSTPRGKILHARNQHLRNHRGFSVAFPNGFSLVFSNVISLFSGILQRVVTIPVAVDFHWKFPIFSAACSHESSLL